MTPFARARPSAFIHNWKFQSLTYRTASLMSRKNVLPSAVGGFFCARSILLQNFRRLVARLSDFGRTDGAIFVAWLA